MRVSTLILSSFACITLAACSHTPVKNPDPNHTHADFAVWIDGKQLDFSGKEYMSEELTSQEEEALKHQTGAFVNMDRITLQKYLHLHDGNGHVIHRHKPHFTLADFFTSLRLGFTEKCFTSGIPTQDGEVCSDAPFRLFVSGSELPPFDLSYDFKDGEKILLTTASDQTELQKELKLMTDDACLYSKTCPWRGEAPTEHCIADPEVPCTQ